MLTVFKISIVSVGRGLLYGCAWLMIDTHLSLPQLEADVIGCNVYGDGRVAAIDTWNPLLPIRWNMLDDDQVHKLYVTLI